jgi:hypothetical protein
MYGNWLRVSPDELAHAQENLEWATTFAEEAVESADGRVSGTGKAWHALDFLLERRGFPVEIVWGEESFVDEAADDDGFAVDEIEDDWGYGPPRYLTPGQVTEGAAALADLTGDDLIRGVDPAELTRAEIYPQTWDRPGELDRVNDRLPHMQEYFAAAAKNGDAIICWLG